MFFCFKKKPLKTTSICFLKIIFYFTLFFKAENKKQQPNSTMNFFLNKKTGAYTSRLCTFSTICMASD